MLAACATDASKLAALLADSLPAQEAETIRTHIALCKSCQSELDRLTDEPALAAWQDDFKPGAGPSLQDLSSLLSKLGTPLSAETVTEIARSGASGAPTLEAEAVLGHLGSFRLLAIVGRGGMGVVYRAYDPELRRIVAIKILLAEHLDEPARARFMREARAAAGIQHEHVVPVHAVVTSTEGSPYLVMQYIDGRTLREATQAAKGISPRDAARLVREAALGVSAAHRLGLIHRDIKPSNILVDSATKKAMVSDFGLVRRQDSADGVTQTGILAGTPEYMSPEQIRAPESIDARADVYALGATLYEALTGLGPFHGTPHMVLQQVLHDEPVSLRRLNDTIPADLETICLKAMAKEPAQRYATAQDFAEDLRRWLDEEPILARPVGPLERSWRWCRRNPRIAWLSGSVAALLVLLAAGASMTAVYMSDKATEASELTRKADDAKRAEAKAAKEATDRLWDALLAEAQGRHWSGKPGRNFASIKALTDAAKIRPSLELRNEAIACMVLPDVRPFQQFELPVSFDKLASTGFDAALAYFAYRDEDDWVRVVRVADRREIFAKKHPAVWILFSPGGGYVMAYHPKTGITVWNVQSNAEVLHIPHETSTGIVCANMPSDEGRLAVNFADGTLHFYDLVAGKEEKKMPFALGSYAFLPHQSKVAVNNGQSVQIWDWQTRKKEKSIQHANLAGVPAWHPSGRSFASALGQNRMIVLDAQTGQVQSNFETGIVTAFTFNQRGDWLVTHGSGQTIHFWDPRTGREIMKFPGGIIGFFQDDQRFAYFKDREVGILEVATGREARTLHPAGPGPRLHTLALHPGGRLAVSTHNDGIRLWDCASGKQVETLPTGVSRLVHFGPSGDSMLTFSSLGVERWPLHFHGDTVSVGPATLICPFLGGRNDYYPGCTPDDRWAITFASESQAAVVDLQAPEKSVFLGEHKKVATLGISPDGQWAITGTQYEPI